MGLERLGKTHTKMGNILTILAREKPYLKGTDNRYKEETFVLLNLLA